MYANVCRIGLLLPDQESTWARGQGTVRNTAIHSLNARTLLWIGPVK